MIIMIIIKYYYDCFIMIVIIIIIIIIIISSSSSSSSSSSIIVVVIVIVIVIDELKQAPPQRAWGLKLNLKRHLSWSAMRLANNNKPKLCFGLPRRAAAGKRASERDRWGQH